MKEMRRFRRRVRIPSSFRVHACSGRDLIRERTQAGLDLARKRGKKFGRPLATDSKQRARITRLRQSGHSLRVIAERVGVGRGTVERVLAADH